MKFPSSLFLLLLFNWIIGFPCQLLQAGELAWDFDENTGEWEAAKGIWQIKDEVYHQKQRWGEAIHSLVGQNTLYRLKFESTKVTGLVLFFAFDPLPTHQYINHQHHQDESKDKR